MTGPVHRRATGSGSCPRPTSAATTSVDLSLPPASAWSRCGSLTLSLTARRSSTSASQRTCVPSLALALSLLPTAQLTRLSSSLRTPAARRPGQGAGGGAAATWRTGRPGRSRRRDGRRHEGWWGWTRCVRRLPLSLPLPSLAPCLPTRVERAAQLQQQVLLRHNEPRGGIADLAFPSFPPPPPARSPLPARRIYLPPSFRCDAIRTRRRSWWPWRWARRRTRTRRCSRRSWRRRRRAGLVSVPRASWGDTRGGT